MLISSAFWFLCTCMCVQGHSFLDKFNQKTYKIKNFRMEIPYYDKEYMNSATMLTYKYNRTTPAVNSSFNFKMDVDDRMDTVVQAYKFASNQYRLFPMRFQLNFQEAIDADVGGSQLLFKCGNITRINFLKNVVYTTCNFVLDETKLPPLIPTGEYRFLMDFVYLGHKLFSFNSYFEIYIPIKY